MILHITYLLCARLQLYHAKFKIAIYNFMVSNAHFTFMSHIQLDFASLHLADAASNSIFFISFADFISSLILYIIAQAFATYGTEKEVPPI